MISIPDARARAGTLLAKRARDWAVDPAAAREAGLVVALHPPTEGQVLADLPAARLWRDEWRELEREASGEVALTWITRAWPSVGRQAVPTHLEIVGADAIAAFAGASEWAVLRDRAAVARNQLGDTDPVRSAVRAVLPRLVGYDQHRFDDVIAVAGWLAAHPATGYRPRQVPIRGVDSKWLGTHRAVVTSLVRAVTGVDELGLVDADLLIRVRVLDPSLLPSGPGDFAAPVGELARMPLHPPTVLVLENLESVLALPRLPGVVALHGSGYAVGAAADVPWVRRARVLYWGDLDSNGFAILHGFRSRLPDVETVLMDIDTLHAFRDLWVSEPAPARGTYSTLTRSETAALSALQVEGNVRLEQERIPWDFALTRIRRLVDEPTSSAGQSVSSR